MKYINRSSAINLVFVGVFLLSSTVSAQAEQAIEVKEAYKYKVNCRAMIYILHDIILLYISILV